MKIEELSLHEVLANSFTKTIISLIISQRAMGSEMGFQNVMEQTEAIELHVVGRIPPWLEGDLFRTGPGYYDYEEKSGQHLAIQHWFDGKALNHRFRVSGRDNKVYYHSRFACSDQMKKEDASGRSSIVTFNQPHDPCESLFLKLKTAFWTLAGSEHQNPSSSNANVNVVIRYDDEKQMLITSTDNPTLQQIDPTTLEPVRVFSFQDSHKSLSGHMSAAHSAIIDGTVYNYVLKFGPKPFYKIFKIDKNGQSRILARIFDAPAAYLHSLAVTENYLVLSIWQADIKNMGLGIPLKNNILDSIAEWSPNRRTIHFILNRHSGKLLRKCKSEAFFCFHHINAYETQEGTNVILDLITYEDLSILKALRLSSLRKFDSLSFPRPQYRRIVLPTNITDETNDRKYLRAREPCSKLAIELPVVNPNVLWHKARYAYGVHQTFSENTRQLFSDSLLKLDLDDQGLDDQDNIEAHYERHLLWQHDGMIPGEPIFIPRPDCDGPEEDDGVILTVALDVVKRSSQLVIL